MALCYFSPAEQRTTNSLNAIHRFDESYWLSYCLRTHWFFSLIVFSTNTRRGKAASEWCTDISEYLPHRKHPKTDTCQDHANEHRQERSCRAGAGAGAGVARTCWATLPSSRTAARRRTLVSLREGFDLFALASASSIYKDHEREWVIHLSVFLRTRACVCLTYFCCPDMGLAFLHRKY